MLTPEDKDLLVKKGISEQQIAEQLACFEKGFPFLKLDAAASVEKGIMAPAEIEMKNYLEAWDHFFFSPLNVKQQFLLNPKNKFFVISLS